MNGSWGQTMVTKCSGAFKLYLLWYQFRIQIIMDNRLEIYIENIQLLHQEQLWDLQTTESMGFPIDTC